MNYQKLLKKYIEHVGNCEGTSFLGKSAIGVFTKKEKYALDNLSLEPPHNERTKGYYWVRYKLDGPWEPALWESDFWWNAADEVPISDRDVAIVGERLEHK